MPPTRNPSTQTNGRRCVVRPAWPQVVTLPCDIAPADPLLNDVKPQENDSDPRVRDQMSPVPHPYQAALRLEQLLGDPGTPANLLSFRNAMAWDEQEKFPEPAIVRLHQLGLPDSCVPKSLGGQFESCEGFIALGRTLARRDMSVVVSYSTLLWSMIAWMGGEEKQQHRLARAILQDAAFPCLAYSESLHGADLMANETVARVDASGRYWISGEKWPINRATRSQWIVLLARTDSGSHLHNHSMFVFDKARVDAGEYHHLPAAKTHGLRGCDISGIRFCDCRLPEDARVGREGDGMELALKGFQMTRTFCTALSLGVGDSALRMVVDFACSRRLYGGCVADLPPARDTLANAYLSQLMAECATTVAARGLHLFPGQFATWSSIAKVQVARLTDHAVHELAAVLGARSYLREGHAEGMFQKFLRDGAIVSVFDGSNPVCLNRLATALPRLCRPRQDEPAEASVAALFDLRRPLPSLGFDRLSWVIRGADAVLQSLPLLATKLEGVLPDRNCDVAALARLQEGTRRLLATVAELKSAVGTGRTAGEPRGSAVLFGMAERYCALHTAVCCLGFWIYNRDHLGDFVARGEWLAAALDRQGEAHFRCGLMSPVRVNGLCQQLFEQTARFQMYSLMAWPLASPGQREDDSGARLWASV